MDTCSMCGAAVGADASQHVCRERGAVAQERGAGKVDPMESIAQSLRVIKTLMLVSFGAAVLAAVIYMAATH